MYDKGSCLCDEQTQFVLHITCSVVGSRSTVCPTWLCVTDITTATTAGTSPKKPAAVSSRLRRYGEY